MNCKIVTIKAAYDDQICEIIKKVGAEFGASGAGFGPADSEVLAMSQYYKDDDLSQYFVALINGNVVGGCGIAAFSHNAKVCELRKLFLQPEGRGLGLGKKLTNKCLGYAKNKGFQQCYLDTLMGMKSAIALYEKLGFRHLDKPLEASIHNGCDVWMLKNL